MTAYVVDSSVITKWLNSVDELNLEEADKLLSDALEGKIELITPELAKYEVGNVLLLKKKLSAKEFEIPLRILFTSPIKFIPQSELLAREAFNIAQQSGVTYYDASFMSLAKLYNATLITENPKHQGRSKQIKISTLKDY